MFLIAILVIRKQKDRDNPKMFVAIFNKFFHAMLNRGIYLPPSAFESWFLSNALSKKDLDNTIDAAKESLKEIGAIA